MKNVYVGSKIFHFPEKLADLQARRQSAPLHVRLKPTNRCNHSCTYCCFRNENLYLGERMNEADQIPREKMQEIVADLGRMGVRAVTFSGGGEPLLYPHIVEAIQGLLRAGVKVAVLTNGALLRGKVAEVLACHATWIRVSMDAADAETYARNRRVATGEFEKVCGNIRNFSRISDRTCALGVNLIVTRENSGDVEAFLRMAKELGADHVKVSVAVVGTSPRENAEYLTPFFDAVKEQLAKATIALADDSFSIVDKVHLPESVEEGFERSYPSCPFAQCLTVIAADQSVYTCQDKAYTESGLLGSIKDRSFAELWASDELKQALLRLDPSCECRHHCVAHGKNLVLMDYLQAHPEHVDFV